MEEFGQDYLQLEMGRAITDMQSAQSALMRAMSASTIGTKELRQAWSLAIANNRSAIWLASTISVAEAVGYLPSISPDLLQAPPIGTKNQ